MAGLREVLPALRHDVQILVEISPPALAAFGMKPAEFVAVLEAAGFEALEVPNLYSPEFYVAGEIPRIVPLHEAGPEPTDLLFRRRQAAVAP